MNHFVCGCSIQYGMKWGKGHMVYDFCISLHLYPILCPYCPIVFLGYSYLVWMDWSKGTYFSRKPQIWWENLWFLAMRFPLNQSIDSNGGKGLNHLKEAWPFTNQKSTHIIPLIECTGPSKYPVISSFITLGHYIYIYTNHHSSPLQLKSIRTIWFHNLINHHSQSPFSTDHSSPLITIKSP